MTYIIDILLIFGGFSLLIWGADILVTGASTVAKKLHVSDLAIGMTMVAFGTSLPELAVNMLSAFQGKSDLAMGNIIGSNIFNILIILGLSAILRPITVETLTTWTDIPYCLIITTAFIILSADAYIDRTAIGFISRSDGLILLLLFSIFLYYTLRSMGNEDQQEMNLPENPPMVMTLLKTFSGLVFLTSGSYLAITGASSIARMSGISERIIGLTILAAGTSLPELFTSTVAAWKGNSSLAIGNVVGSNIFNITFIAGITTVILPAGIPLPVLMDALMSLIAGVFLFIFIFTGPGRMIDRREGFIFLALYAAYFFWLLNSR